MHSGSFYQLLIQIVGALALIGWTTTISGIFFVLLKALNRFRVGQVFELYGMDILEFAQKSSESEVEQSLQFNQKKLSKLETRQRRAAH